MQWHKIEDQARRLGTQTGMVLREEVQKSILTEMAKRGCFKNLVFQGGTALRLFYGNPRFSEDIDLVIDPTNNLSRSDNFEGFDLSRLLPNIERTVAETFTFFEQVKTKIQKTSPELKRYILSCDSANPAQKLRIHIELAAIPSYRNRPMILDYPPVHPAVRVEEVDEILADKVCALALRPYLKGRDLWDIHYLTRERSVTVDWGLVLQKVGDYTVLDSEKTRMSEERLEKGLEKARDGIEHDGRTILENEMVRFLPKQVLEAYRSSFDSILEAVMETITGPVDEPTE